MDGGQHWEGTQEYRFDCELINGVLPLRVDDQTGLGFRQPYIAIAANALPSSSERQTETDAEKEVEMEKEGMLPQSDHSSAIRQEVQEEHQEQVVPLMTVARQMDIPEEGTSLVTAGPETPQNDATEKDGLTQSMSSPSIAHTANKPCDGSDNAYEDISAEQKSPLATTNLDASETNESVKIAPMSPPMAVDHIEAVPDKIDREVFVEQREDHTIVPSAENGEDSKDSVFDSGLATNEQILLEEAQRLLSERDTE